MDAVITGKTLKTKAKEAMDIALKYMNEHRCKSVWTGNPSAGWYERWKPGVYAGLYATCSALMLYSLYQDQYSDLIKEAIPELEHMFIGQSDDGAETDAEKRNREDICRKRLRGNTRITLKAVYYLMACLKLEENNLSNDRLKEIMEDRWQQIMAAYDPTTGKIFPAKDNREDYSVLTTVYAYILLSKSDAYKVETQKTQTLFISYIRDYIQFAEREQNISFARNEIDKFEKYDKKRNFVAALFALSHAVEKFNNDAAMLDFVTDAVFLSLNDKEVRTGFSIKDTYRDSLTAGFNWETLLADSRLLYLNSILKLLKADILPISVLELFMDDIEEIIDTIDKKQQYLSWDESPTFSHHIRGLNVLQSLIELLDDSRIVETLTFMKISPYIFSTELRSINRYSVVMFMHFSEKYDDTFTSVEEVLNAAGFTLWRSTSEPYDTSIMDRIMDRMIKAQFVIIDCSESKQNVFYEAGLSHGFGKKVFICSTDEQDFPYGTTGRDCHFNNNLYQMEGRNSPYKDLQESLITFIKRNIEDFCLTRQEKDEIRVKLDTFWKEKTEDSEL